MEEKFYLNLRFDKILKGEKIGKYKGEVRDPYTRESTGKDHRNENHNI